jgi:hypothetical protein
MHSQIQFVQVQENLGRLRYTGCLGFGGAYFSLGLTIVALALLFVSISTLWDIIPKAHAEWKAKKGSQKLPDEDNLTESGVGMVSVPGTSSDINVL